MTASTIERAVTAPGRVGNDSRRPIEGQRRYLVVNGHIMDVTGSNGGNSAEAFTVHPAVQDAYEFLTTHHSVINAAMIMTRLRDLADAIQRDATIATKIALEGGLVLTERPVFGNPPHPRPAHATEQ